AAQGARRSHYVRHGQGRARRQGEEASRRALVRSQRSALLLRRGARVEDGYPRQEPSARTPKSELHHVLPEGCLERPGYRQEGRTTLAGKRIRSAVEGLLPVAELTQRHEVRRG